MSATHETFMARALELAREAAQRGDVPVGCVIVKDGKIIGQGRNMREEKQSALLHAEIAAIDGACKALGSRRLEGCDMYVTLEPCPMCAGAILNSRISRVFYGAGDENMGACGGVINIFEEAFGFKPKLYRGILEKECSSILTDFFEKLR